MDTSWIEIGKFAGVTALNMIGGFIAKNKTKIPNNLIPYALPVVTMATTAVATGIGAIVDPEISFNIANVIKSGFAATMAIGVHQKGKIIKKQFSY
jgi:hypothetical protein